jgi:hypothetical protein
MGALLQNGLADGSVGRNITLTLNWGPAWELAADTYLLKLRNVHLTKGQAY